MVGLDGFIGYQERAYRISEERLIRQDPLPMNIWWDRTFGDDLSVRFEIMNVTPARRKRTRDIYEAGRAGGAITAVEERKTKQAIHFMLRVRKRF